AILRGIDRPLPINERFNVVHDNIDVNDTTLFEREPGAMLEVFYHVQRDERVKGVTARTIRAIRRCRHLIDETFRADRRNKTMFLRIMDASAGVTHELRRMNRYGVLGAYIPAFERIVGRMQYDLFHAYTVDAHTLFVVSNLRRFALTRFNDEHPYCSQIMQRLDKPLIIYLAGLFHDIAKGRGGDHSELGSVDAQAFCDAHGMSAYDTRLVSWLVRHHLDLSITAQKKDINDPQVINDFAALVGDQIHLDYLYLLTVADVRATNPKLFNSWKAQLFENLYRQTTRALDRGLANPFSRSELIAENRDGAHRLLSDGHLANADWQRIWQDLGDEYFLQHGPREVVWHTEQLSQRDDPEDALVALRKSDIPGLILVLWYAPQSEDGFARATAILDELGLNIVDARIASTSNGFSLDTYRVLDTQNPGEVDPRRLRQIEEACARALAASPALSRAVRRTPRQARMFRTPTQLEFVVDLTRQRTVMEMVAADRPGLLSHVGSALQSCRVQLRAAKITTVGERAENVFFLCDQRDGPLSDEACAQLDDAVRARIERVTA
ncbi:MAG: [protein-PII] uridylyltransferase, partial [Pseudomonadota bacterium]